MSPAPDEEELHAYVDGRLMPERHAKVTSWLQEHPDTAARMAGWQRDAAAMRAALVDAQMLPPNPALDPTRLRWRARARRGSRFATAASLVFALLLGGFGGWLLRDAREPGWVPMADAVAAYRLFAQGEAPLEPADSLQRAARGWLLSHFGAAGEVPDLRTQGLALRDVRMLSTPEGAAAMLVYEDAEGGRLGLYLRPRSPRLQVPGERRDGQLLAKYWSQGNVSIAVVGPANRDQVRRIAPLLQAQAG